MVKEKVVHLHFSARETEAQREKLVIRGCPAAEKQQSKDSSPAWAEPIHPPTGVPGLRVARTQVVSGGSGKPSLLARAHRGTGGETPVTQLPIVCEVLSRHLDVVPGSGPHSPEDEGRGFNGPHLREERASGH